jgi:hypothetical protein
MGPGGGSGRVRGARRQLKYPKISTCMEFHMCGIPLEMPEFHRIRLKKQEKRKNMEFHI